MYRRAQAIILAAVLGGCGGGDSGNSAPPPPFKATILDVDSGFLDAPVLYTIDSGGSDPFPSNNHGLRVVERIREYSDADIIGWVSFEPDGYTNFSDAILWGAENVQVVLIEFGGCCYVSRQEVTRQAFERGVTVVWPSGNGGGLLPGEPDPYMLVIGSLHGTPDYGPAVDTCLDNHGGTSFNAAEAAGRIAELYEELNPTPDAVGARLIRDTFIQRFGRVCL